jgi:hypothetical protein
VGFRALLTIGSFLLLFPSVAGTTQQDCHHTHGGMFVQNECWNGRTLYKTIERWPNWGGKKSMFENRNKVEYPQTHTLFEEE